MSSHACSSSHPKQQNSLALKFVRCDRRQTLVDQRLLSGMSFGHWLRHLLYLLLSQWFVVVVSYGSPNLYQTTG